MRIDEQARAWLATAAWVALVLLLSSDSFSHAQTGSLFARLMAFVAPDLDREQLRWVHALVRKSAHVVEYAILGFLALRALLVSVPVGRSVFWALLLAVTVAFVDVGFQATSAVRTGHPKDVLIDSLGAVLGIAGGLWHRRRP